MRSPLLLSTFFIPVFWKLLGSFFRTGLVQAIEFSSLSDSSSFNEFACTAQMET